MYISQALFIREMLDFSGCIVLGSWQRLDTSCKDKTSGCFQLAVNSDRHENILLLQIQCEVGLELWTNIVSAEKLIILLLYFTK